MDDQTHADDIALIRRLTRKMLETIEASLDAPQDDAKPSTGRASPVSAIVSLSRLLLKLGETERKLRENKETHETPKDIAPADQQLSEKDIALVNMYLERQKSYPDAGPIWPMSTFHEAGDGPS